MTIRVNVRDSRNGAVEYRNEIVEMPAVPRIGDTFHWDVDDTGFTVKSVLWIANGDYDVAIRGW